MDPNVRISQELRLEHRHNDGSWSPMRPNHDGSADHDERQEIFRVRDGMFVEVWHLEDIGSLMRSFELEPPKFLLRAAARRSARRFRRTTALASGPAVAT